MIVSSSIWKRPPKILLTGRSGQVGRDLYPILSQLGDVFAPDRNALDLSKSEHIRDCIQTFCPDVIINAAAYTAVDKAEADRELAHVVNAVAPAVFAKEAEKSGALLIHYSTDYVFDGTKQEPYIESDATNPLNTYGRTKLAGEEAISESGCNYLILRTSWVYSSAGSNFLLTILRLAKEREELRIVNDQIGAPTYSGSVADATAEILEQYFAEPPAVLEKSGIYHATASGACSWFEFAAKIIEHASSGHLQLKKLIRITTHEYPTAARRPLNSRLNCSRIVSHVQLASTNPC